MSGSTGCRSLRSESYRCPTRARRASLLPRMGGHRGLVAGLAPPTGSELSRGRKEKAPAKGSPPVRDRTSFGARALLTMSVVFPLFGK